MMYRHSVHQHTSARQRGLLLFGVWLTACGLLLPPWAQAQAPDPSTARALSRTFTEVSHQALPAVVSITVERTAEIKSPLPFATPFDWFGEEFFERFFRWRLPEGW